MSAKKTRTCLVCKSPFKGRIDAKTCSPACRKRLQRSTQAVVAEKTRRMESALGEGFQKVASAMFKQHAIHEPLVLADERGAIPVAEPPVTTEPQAIPVAPAPVVAPEPIAVAPAPEPVVPAPAPEPVAAEPIPVAVAPEPAAAPSPEPVSVATAPAPEAVAPEPVAVAPEPEAAGEAVPVTVASEPAAAPADEAATLPSAESLEPSVSPGADEAGLQADASVAETAPSAVHLEDVMSTESLESTGTTAEEASAAGSGEEGPPVAENVPKQGAFSLFHYNRIALLATSLALLLIAVISSSGFFLLSKHNKQPVSPNSPASYAVGSLPLKGIKGSQSLQVGKIGALTINGQLRVTDSLVLEPGSAPNQPSEGQIYFDQTAKAPFYYNGSQFVSLAPKAFPQHVGSIGGASGAITLGNSLSVVNNQLAVASSVLQSINDAANGGVLSLDGTVDQVSVSAHTGHITLSLPQNIAVSSAPTFAGATLNGHLSVTTGGADISGSIQLASLGTGLVQSDSTGLLSSSAVDRNNSSLFSNTLSVANGGTGAGSFTANGVLYGNGTGSFLATNSLASAVLVTNLSGTPSLSQTLPLAVQNNITQTGQLVVGSINNGFGAISTNNNITTSALIQAGSIQVDGGSFTVDNGGDFNSGGSGVIQGSGGLTIGVAGTTTGGLTLADAGSSFTTTVQAIAQAGRNQTITIPASSAANDTVCLLFLGNCTGAGSGVTSVGTEGYIARFSNAAANQIGDSLLYDNGVSVGIGTNTPGASYLLDINGALHVAGASTFDGDLTAAADITQSGTGSFSTGTGAVSLNGNTTVTGSNTFSVGSGAATFGGTLHVTTALTTLDGGLSVNGATNVIGFTNINSSGTANTAIGNATGTFGLTSSGLNVSTAGALSGITGYVQTSGNFAQSGTGSFSTGSGAVSLNGAVTASSTLNVLGPGGITVGVSGSVDGVLNLANTTNNNLSIIESGVPTGTGNATYFLPSIPGGTSDTICVLSTQNCAASGSAGGDLTGTFPNPTIAKLQGTPLVISSLASGDILQYDGVNFVNGKITNSNFAAGTALGNVTGVGALTSGSIGVGFGDINIGTNVFTGDGSGLTNLNGSAVSSGTVGNAYLVNGGALTVTAGTGLTGGGLVALGGSTTLNVSYGAAAGTAAQGNSPLSFTGAGNLTGTVSGTAGGGFTTNTLDVVSSPDFTGSLTVEGAGGVTIGVAGSTAGVINLANGTNTNLSTVQSAAPTGTGNAAYTLPSIAGGTSDTICLETLGNCSGISGAAGGDLTGTYPNPTIAKLQGTTLTISSLNSGDVLQYNGTAFVNGHITNANLTAGNFASIQGTGALTSGSIASGFGTISTANSITTTAALQGGTLAAGSSGQFQVDASGNVITSGTFNTAHITGGTLSGGNVSGGTLTGSSVNGLNVSGGVISSPTVSGTVTGSGTPTITGFGTYNGQTIDSAANFTGTLAVQGNNVSIGTPGTTAGTLSLANGTNTNLSVIQSSEPTGTGDATYVLPAIDGGTSDTFCLFSLANCSASGAAGGDLTGTYPDPTIASLQGTTLTISSLASGDILQYNGTAFVNNAVSGDITINGSGVTTIGNGKVTNAKLQNSSVTITAGTGLSGGGAVALGSSTSLSVTYGAAAGTAAQGNSPLSFTGSGNLTGTVSGTAGGGFTTNTLAIVNNPTFTTSVTSPLFNLTSGSFSVGLQSDTQANDVALSIPADTNATDTICLETLGNCSGSSGAAGGDLTGTYPNPTIAKLQGNTLTLGLLNAGDILQYDGSEIVNNPVSGDITIDGSGVTTIGNGKVTNAKLQNSALTVTAGTGLTGGGAVALGSSTTLNVAYGSSAGTAAQGNSALSFTGAGNLTGTVSGTAGGGFTTNTLDIVASPTFSGNLAVEGTTGVTVGVAGSTNGLLRLANDTNTNLSTIQAAAPTGTGDATYIVPSIAGGSSDTFCLLTLGNCTAGGSAGGDLTGSYPNPTIAKLQGTTLTISSLASGDILQYNGTAWVNGKITNSNLQAGAFSNITGVGALTSGSIGGSFGNINIGTNIFTGDGSGLTNLNASNVATGTLDDNRLSPNVTLQGNTFNGPSELVQLTAGGILPVLDASNLTNLNGSAISSGTVANTYLVNGGALTVTAGTGLNGGGSVALGGSTTLNVVYGSTSGTAAQGNTSLSFTGSGNLTGTVSGTAGGGFTTNTLAIVNSPTFSGTLAVQGAGGVTVGVAGSTAGVINLANATNSSLSVISAAAPTGTGNATYSLPAIAGGTSDNICLQTLANCSGATGAAGGDLTGTYPNPTIASLQGTTLTLSSLASGDVLQYNGSAIVNGHITNSNLTAGTFSAITGTGALSAGSIASGFGTISTGNTITGTTLNGTAGINTGAGAGTQRIDASGNLVNIGTITGSSALAIAAGSTGQALSLDASTSGQILIGGTSTGDILLGGGSGSTGCTVTNSTGAFGCASDINTSGNIKTGGNIRLTSTGNLQNIGSLTLSGAISGGTTYTGSGNINTTGGGLQTNSVTRIDNSGNATLGTITSGLINGQTISSSANFTGTLAVQGSGGITVGVAGSTDGAINLANGTNSNLSVIKSGVPTGTGSATYNLPTIAGGSSDTLCLFTLGNCSASGTAGGDLTGTYPNPTIASLQGTTLTLSSLASGDVLQYDGSDIVNGHITNTNLTSGTFSAITGTGALSAGSIASGFGTISTGNNITTTATVQGGTLNATGVIQLGGADINTAGTLTNVAYLNQANNFSAANTFSAAGTALSVTNNATVGGVLTATTSITTPAINSAAALAITGGTTLTLKSTTSSTATFDSGTTGAVNVGTGANAKTVTVGSTTGASTTVIQAGSGGITLTGAVTGSSTITGTTLNGTAGINTGAGAGTQRIDASGNLVNIGTITSGLINGQTISSSANFTGTLAVQGSTLSIGTPGTTVGSINLSTSASNSRQLILQGLNPSGTGNATIQFPTIAGGSTDTVCLVTLGNCSGSGGGVTSTGGTAGTLAVFTGGAVIGNSVISEVGSDVTVAGTLAVTGANSLALGASSSATGSATFYNSTNAHTLTLQSGASGSDLTFTLPTADGSNGQCLQTDGLGVLAFGGCTGGAGGGVTSLDGLTGVLTLNNSTGAGANITINNAKADASTKGIATFNATNFSDNGSGTINTIQDINSTATPNFAGAVLGNPGSSNGTLTLANSTSTREVILQGLNPSGTGNATIQIPTIAGGSTDTICLQTLKNCPASGTAGGDLTGTYPNPTIASLQGTTLTLSGLASGDVLQYNGSAIVNGHITNSNLTAGSFGAIQGTGALSSGSIASGFGTISTGNNITTTATVQGGIVNATSTLELGGADINTAGTLTNVAYLNQANAFTNTNSINTNSATAFKVEQTGVHNNTLLVDTANGRVGVGKVPGVALDVSGTVNASTSVTSPVMQLSGAGGSASSLRRNAVVGTGGVTANDVVVYANDGGNTRILDTTTAHDPRVFGVAISTGISGATVQVAIVGDVSVTADTGAVAIGDQLVTSTTSGQVTVDNNATTGILGYALSTKSAGSSGTVTARLQVHGGQTNPTVPGNLTVNGTVTSGLINGQTISSSANFTGTLAVATSVSTPVVKVTSGSFNVSISSASQANNVALSIPADTNTSDTICLQTLANCTFSGTTAGGDLTGTYPNPTIASLQGTTLTLSGLASGDVLQYNGSAIVNGHITNSNLTAGSFGAIQGTGALSSGSIASGFGTISTGNNITTTATVQGGIVNATSTLELGGADINTAGTLTNVAYLNGNNAFSGNNTFQAGSSSSTPVTVKGAASQTADLAQFQTSAGTVLGGIKSSGGYYFGAATLSNTILSITNSTTTATPLGIKLAASQSADSLYIQNSSGAVITHFDSSGHLAIGSASAPGQALDVTGNINASTGYYLNGTQIVDSSRNLNNIGTISSGNINGQTISSTANLTGTLAVATSVSTPTVNVTSGSFNVAVASAAQANNVALSIPADTNTSDTFCLQTLSNCGATGTAGGDLTGTYPNPTIAKLQGTTLTLSSLASGDVLQYNGTAIVNGHITNSNLTAGSFGAIQGTGALSSGSIASGFGTISTGNNITTTATVQGATVNATSVIKLNGTDINTAGTLTDVAYLDQANNFSASQTISATGGKTTLQLSSTGSNTGITFSGDAAATLYRSASGTLKTDGNFVIAGNLTTTNPGTTGTINGANITGGTLSGGSVSGGTLTASAVNGLNVAGGVITSPTITGTVTGSGTPTITGFGSIAAGTYNGQTITSAANFTGTLAVTTLGTADTTTVLCRNTSNQIAACAGTGAGTPFVQGGNSFGATGVLGTLDNFGLNIQTHGTNAISIDTSQNAVFAGNVTTTGTVQGGTVNATSALQTNGTTRIDSVGNLSNILTITAATTATANSGTSVEGSLALTANPSSAPAAQTDFIGIRSTTSSSSANVNSNTRFFGASVGTSFSGSGTLGTSYGNFMQTSNAGAGTITTAFGGNGVILNGSNGNITTGTALQGTINSTGTGTISNARALDASVINNNGGTLTNAYGLRVETPNNSGVGSTIGTDYGVYIGAQAGAGIGTAYGLYQAGASDTNILAGSTRIGSTSAPSYPLDVTGNINTSTGYLIGGANINTAGTLNNVAYLNQANNFSAANTFSAAGTALSVTNDASVGGTLTAGTVNATSAYQLGGTQIVDSSRNLVNIGDAAINGGDITTNQTAFNLLNATATTVNAFGAATAINLGAAGATVTGGGALTVQSGAATALTLDSGTTGALNIGNSANAKTITIGNTTGATAVTIQGGTGAINIGTQAVADTVTIGNGTGASSVVLNSGTGAINIGTNAIAHTVTIGNGTGATSVVLNAGTGAVNIGTNAIAHTTTVGSTTGAATTTIQGGTGGINLNDATVATNATTLALFQTNATTINLGNAVGSGGINLAGGSGSTGCTLAGDTGNLQCTGSITSTGGGVVGYWQRTGTDLSPATTGDNVTTSGNISTTGSGSITSASTVTGTTVNGTAGINSGAGAGTQRIDASGNLVNIGSVSASGNISTSGGVLQVGGSGSSYIMGSLGLGVTNPQGALSIANSSWINGLNAAGTSYVNMFELNGDNQIQVGAALNIDGGIELPTDGGQLTLVDEAISAATTGTPEGYTFRVGSTNALTVYGESDGSGGAQNVRVAIGSSIAPQYTLDVGGDVNIQSGSVYRINGADINTAGTLSNVAYENQANNFTLANTFSAAGTALSVTNNAQVGGTLTAAILNATSTIELGGADINTAGTLSNVAYENQANNFTQSQTISNNGGKTTLQLSNTTANVGLTIGGDTNLYRAGLNSLATDDSLTVGTDLNVTGNTNLNGAQLTNNGSTLNSAAALSNYPTGGVIGTAAATVDSHTSFAIPQTTAGQTLSLPTPTSGTAGRMVFVFNTGSTSFTMNGVTIPNGYGQIFIWNGTSWILGASGGGSAITLQSAYDGGNTLTTSDARNISVTLADTTTDANFVVNVASGSTGQFQVQNNGSNVLTIGSAGQLALSVQGTTGGLVIGGDATLYRSNTNTLTAQTLDVTTGLNTGAGFGTQRINSSGALVNIPSLTGSGALTIDASGSNTISLGATSTGDILLGGGSGSTGCTVTNSTGAFACSSTINGATLSASAINGLSVSGGTINNPTISGTVTGSGSPTITGFGAISAGTYNSQTIGSASTFTGTVAVQGANSLTLGTTGSATGSAKFLSASGSGAGAITLTPANPGTTAFTLTLPAENGTLCSTAGSAACLAVYAPAAAGGSGYIQKNVHDTSSASFVGNLLDLTNTNTGAAGVLSLTNSGTNSALSILQSGTSEPGALQALILANNNTTTPSGNLLDLQNKGTSELHVDVSGNLTTLGGITLGSLGTNDTNNIVCRNSVNALALCAGTGTGAPYLQGGNSFGAQAVLGTNDNNSLAIRTNGGNKIVIDTSGNLTFQQASTVSTSTGNLTVQANGTSTLLLDTTGAGTVTVGSTATTLNLSTGTGTNAINLGTNASAVNTINIGTTNSTSTTNIKSGSGGINLNASVNNATNINTGTSSGTVSIGGGSAPLSINSTNFDVSTAGALSGITGYTQNSGNATFTQAAGNQLQVTSGSTVPTTDQVNITNAGSTGVTTAGVNSLSVNYKGGAAAVEGAGERIDLQPGTTSGGTWSALRIVPNATGAVSGVTENGLKLDNLTTPGAGTENAINVGTGWDNVLQSANVTIAQGGNITTAGDLAVNGADITTNQTTATLYATTATTVNIGTAATGASGGINLGGGSGSTGCSVNGSTGDFQCTGAISTLATTGVQGWFTRAGTMLSPTNGGDSVRVYSTGGSQYLTLQSAATTTYLEVRSGDVSQWVLDSAVTTDTQPRFIIKTDGTMNWGGGSSATDTILGRSGAGALYLQPTSGNNSSSAFAIKNSAGNTLLAFDNSLASGRLVIGGTGTSSEKLELYRANNTTANHIYLTTNSGTDWRFGQDTSTEDFSFWQDATNSEVFTLSGSGSNAGAATFQNGADSTAAFQVLDHSNNHVFAIDTSHDTVSINSTPATTTTLYVWAGSTKSGQIINQDVSNTAALLELQHNNSDVFSVGSGGDTTIHDTSTSAFKVQNTGSTNTLNVDTTNSSVTVTGAPLASQTYNYTGGTQTFTVPSGVTSVNLTLYGAGGGQGGQGNTASTGGQTTGTLAVTPGQVLTVYVGGAGGNGTAAGVGGAAGYNGGGTGGNAFSSSYPGGGGGGGASMIKIGATLEAAAGGGGGGAGYGTGTTTSGGSGGGTTGNTGNSSRPGAGGTQSGGGAGAAPSGICGTAATSGSSSQGGAGGIGVGGSSGASGSGGGGGGYFGGGGGDCGTATGNGGGGGGSGYSTLLTGASMTNGVNSGNGQVAITWSPAPALQVLDTSGNTYLSVNSATASTLVKGTSLTAFQVQNSSGTSLLTADTTDNQLIVSGNIVANGSSTFQDSTNTDNAFRIQNSSGTNLLQADTNNFQISVSAGVIISGNSASLNGGSANGGTGSGTTGDNGGGGGGATGTVNAVANNTGTGTTGAQSADVSGLFSVLTSLSIATTSPGTGGANSGVYCSGGTGGAATGFGSGGGGAGFYGGPGGAGRYGGGGGGASGGTGCSSYSGGAGGQGVLVISPTGSTGSFKTSGTSYTVPAGVYSVKIWAVGAGGGGAGTPTGDTFSGGGGAAGGIAYRSFSVVPGQTITYALGGAGAGGSGAANGSAGGSTTVTVGSITLTATGGAGGLYNTGATSTGGTTSGVSNIVPLDVQNSSGSSVLSVVSDGSGDSTYAGLGQGKLNTTYGSTVSLNVTSAALSSTSGSSTLLSDQYASSTTANSVHLLTYDYRTSAGSDWTTDAIILRRVTDVTAQQYISLAPNGSSVCINTFTCNNTLGVSGSIGASGAITASTTPDISETIPASSDVSPADVVSAGPDGAVDAVRSSTPYDTTAIGVISDGSSSFRINSNGDSESADPTGKYLVLAGRVPVHVTDEGGPIQPGDYLTTSSTPGYAMKATQAGPTIGTALAAFSGTSGTVMIQTHLGYYAGPTGADYIQSGGNATLNSLTVNNTANVQDLQATSVEADSLISTTANISSLTSQSTNSDSTTTNTLNVNGDATIANLNASGTVTTNNLDVTGSTSVGTLSATDISASTITTGTLSVGTLNVTDLNVSDSLSVTGDTTIGGALSLGGDLTVTGSAQFTGDITIDGHIITAGGQPTVQVQDADGTPDPDNPGSQDAQVTVSGNDTSGTITITTSDNPTTGSLAKFLFSKAYGQAPHIVLSPSNDKAAGLRFYTGNTSKDDFIFNAIDAPQANTTYKFDYFIAQ